MNNVVSGQCKGSPTSRYQIQHFRLYRRQYRYWYWNNPDDMCCIILTMTHFKKTFNLSMSKPRDWLNACAIFKTKLLYSCWGSQVCIAADMDDFSSNLILQKEVKTTWLFSMIISLRYLYSRKQEKLAKSALCFILSGFCASLKKSEID